MLSCPGSPRETSRKRPMAAVRKECVTMKDNIPYKIYLSEAELPKQWYNVRADMKTSPRRCSTPARSSR